MTDQEWKDFEDSKRIKEIGRAGCHNSCIVKRRYLSRNDATGIYWMYGVDSFGVVKDIFKLTEQDAKKYLDT